MFTKIINKYRNLSEMVKATIWYTICNILNKSIALLSTPIFTRILTEEQYGTFAIFQSWLGIIIIFTSLNIFLGGYQKGLLLYQEEREKFTSSLLGLTTLITLFWFSIYIIGINFWTDILGLSPLLMLAMFVELTLMPALEFWAAKEKFDFKYKKYVIVSVLMTILSLSWGVVAVLNTSYKVEARILTEVIVKSIFSGILFILIFIRGKQVFNEEYWKYAIVFNLPLLPHYLSNYVLNQSDRLMIGKMIGNDKAAFYSVAYTISTVMLLITGAINNSLIPYIYKKIDDFEHNLINAKVFCKDIKKTTTFLFLFVACLCILTMAFAPEVILIFAGRKYTEAIYVIPPIAASVYYIFVYSMFSTIEYYFQKTGFIAIATTIIAILNLILNYIFIRSYGYYAAGYTTLVCFICLAFMHFLFYRKVIRSKLSEIKEVYNLKIILMASFFVISMMLIMVLTYKIVIIRYLLILNIVIVAMIKRKYIMSVLNGLRK